MSVHAEHLIGIGRYDYSTFLMTAAIVAVALVASFESKAFCRTSIFWSYWNGT